MTFAASTNKFCVCRTFDFQNNHLLGSIIRFFNNKVKVKSVPTRTFKRVMMKIEFDTTSPVFKLFSKFSNMWLKHVDKFIREFMFFSIKAIISNNVKIFIINMDDKSFDKFVEKCV